MKVDWRQVGEGQPADQKRPKLEFGYEMPSIEEQTDATVELAESIKDHGWCPPAELANNQIIQGLQISNADATALETNTRQQVGSSIWKKERLNRLTASKFGAMLARKAAWTERGVANVMRPNTFTNQIVRYGTANEPRAVQRYIQCMELIGHNLIVNTCGLM
ncbi:hypothetical protein V5799_019040, partial [Amblyomma americanum]